MTFRVPTRPPYIIVSWSIINGVSQAALQKMLTIFNRRVHKFYQHIFSDHKWLIWTTHFWCKILKNVHWLWHSSRRSLQDLNLYLKPFLTICILKEVFVWAPYEFHQNNIIHRTSIESSTQRNKFQRILKKWWLWTKTRQIEAYMYVIQMRTTTRQYEFFIAETRASSRVEESILFSKSTVKNKVRN